MRQQKLNSKLRCHHYSTECVEDTKVWSAPTYCYSSASYLTTKLVSGIPLTSAMNNDEVGVNSPDPDYYKTYHFGESIVHVLVVMWN